MGLLIFYMQIVKLAALMAVTNAYLWEDEEVELRAGNRCAVKAKDMCKQSKTPETCIAQLLQRSKFTRTCRMIIEEEEEVELGADYCAVKAKDMCKQSKTPETCIAQLLQRSKFTRTCRMI